MAVTPCFCCGGDYHWQWEEAFDKFGFGDGDGQVETASVEAVLEETGYEVESDQWGIHNVVIRSIRNDGRKLMPPEDGDVTVGYDDPRSYLPAEIIRLLDDKLPGSGG